MDITLLKAKWTLNFFDYKTSILTIDEILMEASSCNMDTTRHSSKCGDIKRSVR